MKIEDLKKIVREEAKKILNEADEKDKPFMVFRLELDTYMDPESDTVLWYGYAKNEEDARQKTKLKGEALAYTYAKEVTSNILSKQKKRLQDEKVMADKQLKIISKPMK